PLAFRAETANFCFERHQHRGPIPAGIGFSERSADSSTITDLYVGNARCAVVKNWELRSTGRRLDLRVPSQGAKSQGAVFCLDVRRPGDEIEIHKMLWAGEVQLHQRAQDLDKGDQLGISA